MQIFADLLPKHTRVIISGVSEQKPTKFLHNADRSSPFNLLKS